MKYAALVLILATAAAQAQFMERCSNYQTTGNFDDSFIKMMQTTPGGYIVRLSTVVSDQCQRLQFVDGNDYTFNSIDVARQIQHNYTDRYTVSTATVTMPAKLTLQIDSRAHPIRVVGGDSSGSLTLYPLVANDDMIAFAACHVGIPFMMRERVLVMTPFSHKNKTSVSEMKDVLNAQGVPRIDELSETSIECTPNPNATQPFDIYAIIATPFQRIAQVIPINTGGDSENSIGAGVMSNAAGVAEQTLAYIRGQYPQYLNQRDGEAAVKDAEASEAASVPEAASENLDVFRLAAEEDGVKENSEKSAAVPEPSSVKKSSEASPVKASAVKLTLDDSGKVKPVAAAEENPAVKPSKVKVTLK